MPFTRTFILRSSRVDPLHQIKRCKNIGQEKSGLGRQLGVEVSGNCGIFPAHVLVSGKPQRRPIEIQVVYGGDTICGCGLLSILGLGLSETDPNLGKPFTFEFAVTTL